MALSRLTRIRASTDLSPWRLVLRWSLSSGAGLSLGLAVGSAVVGYGTSGADLLTQGLLSGIGIGAAQGGAVRPWLGAPSAVAWATAVTLLWPLAWTVTRLAGVSVEDQFAVFGASGALTFCALSGLVMTGCCVGAADPWSAGAPTAPRGGLVDRWVRAASTLTIPAIRAIVSRVPKYYTALDSVLRALADPTRRAVVERLAASPAVVSELAAPFSMSLPTLMQHLRVLEDAGLVTSQKHGRVRTVSLLPAALDVLHLWLGEQRTPAEDQADRLGVHLIRTTPKEIR